ncbi:unnamed protein product [Prorocentrum cordatum]|uniref:Uncharacterized protein n=1 Tax=Prorocentrum cordatum TaxID=2364126 RepID=A0ABN9T0W1_9DINO|nr:unnamed protein product [Polarella glacialis]
MSSAAFSSTLMADARGVLGSSESAWPLAPRPAGRQRGPGAPARRSQAGRAKTRRPRVSSRALKRRQLATTVRSCGRCEKERETYRERGRETDRQTERERETERESERERGRETAQEREREFDGEKDIIFLTKAEFANCPGGANYCSRSKRVLDRAHSVHWPGGAPSCSWSALQPLKPSRPEKLAPSGPRPEDVKPATACNRYLRGNWPLFEHTQSAPLQHLALLTLAQPRENIRAKTAGRVCCLRCGGSAETAAAIIEWTVRAWGGRTACWRVDRLCYSSGLRRAGAARHNSHRWLRAAPRSCQMCPTESAPCWGVGGRALSSSARESKKGEKLMTDPFAMRGEYSHERSIQENGGPSALFKTRNTQEGWMGDSTKLEALAITIATGLGICICGR